MNKLFAGLGALTLTLGATAAPQLNVSGFSRCLSEVEPTGAVSSLKSLAARYDFNPGDGLLFYLAVYPGKYIPVLSEALQKPGAERWSGTWERKEEALAEAIVSLSGSGDIFPPDIFQAALVSCGPDLFCASLLSHNVLRTLGRYPRAVYHSPSGEAEDRNPVWFQTRRETWLNAIPGIQERLIPLRADGKGDRWGEWYHFFGLLAFGAHEAALGKDPSTIDFVASMNKLLNPWLAGGPEEPEKAQLDLDSAAVVRDYLQWNRSLDGGDCRFIEDYVNLGRTRLVLASPPA